MALLDAETRYSVAGYGGVAFAYAGDELAPDDDTEWTGEYVPTGRALMVMVGDDRRFAVEPDDVSPLADGDYCPSCGQVGCRAFASDGAE